MTTPLFVATNRFDPSDQEKWEGYCKWAKIPALVEIVGLDTVLCRNLLDELQDEDWKHNVHADFRLRYFYDWEYLRKRFEATPQKNILGLYRNPDSHITEPPAPKFSFVGYDLIEEMTHISALTNCGGFPDVFGNDELNRFGIFNSFERVWEVRRLLTLNHPAEPHAKCEMYAIWRLNV